MMNVKQYQDRVIANTQTKPSDMGRESAIVHTSTVSFNINQPES